MVDGIQEVAERNRSRLSFISLCDLSTSINYTPKKAKGGFLNSTYGIYWIFTRTQYLDLYSSLPDALPGGYLQCHTKAHCTYVLWLCHPSFRFSLLMNVRIIYLIGQ